MGDEQHGLLGRRGQDVLHQRLRGGRVEVGGRLVEQLEENVATLDNLELTEGELEEIDRYATDSGINLWAASSEN